MAENEDSDIPQRYVEFCKAVGRLAREYKLRDMAANFNPGFDSPWQERVELSWDSSRHHADAGIVNITSIRRLRTTVDTEESKGREL